MPYGCALRCMCRASCSGGQSLPHSSHTPLHTRHDTHPTMHPPAQHRQHSTDGNQHARAAEAGKKTDASVTAIGSSRHSDMCRSRQHLTAVVCVRWPEDLAGLAVLAFLCGLAQLPLHSALLTLWGQLPAAREHARVDICSAVEHQPAADVEQRGEIDPDTLYAIVLPAGHAHTGPSSSPQTAATHPVSQSGVCQPAQQEWIAVGAVHKAQVGAPALHICRRVRRAGPSWRIAPRPAAPWHQRGRSMARRSPSHGTAQRAGTVPGAALGACSLEKPRAAAASTQRRRSESSYVGAPAGV
jgi:hypothetical protein